MPNRTPFGRELVALRRKLRKMTEREKQKYFREHPSMLFPGARKAEKWEEER